MRHRHRIPERSQWFPTRSFAEQRAQWHLRVIFEQLALGTPQRQDQDREWFERQLAATVKELSEQAIRTDAFALVRTVIGNLQTLAHTCIEAKEVRAGRCARGGRLAPRSPRPGS